MERSMGNNGELSSTACMHVCRREEECYGDSIRVMGPSVSGRRCVLPLARGVPLTKFIEEPDSGCHGRKNGELPPNSW